MAVPSLETEGSLWTLNPDTRTLSPQWISPGPPVTVEPVNLGGAGLINRSIPVEPVHISLRLERMALTDAEAAMVAGWCAAHAHVVLVRKLWLFDNRLGDEGAAAVAAMLHDRVLEVRWPQDSGFWCLFRWVGFGTCTAAGWRWQVSAVRSHSRCTGALDPDSNTPNPTPQPNCTLACALMCAT